MYFSSRGEPMETNRHGSKGSTALGCRRPFLSSPPIADMVRNQSQWLLPLQEANLEDSPRAAPSATPDFLLPSALQSGRWETRSGAGSRGWRLAARSPHFLPTAERDRTNSTCRFKVLPLSLLPQPLPASGCPWSASLVLMFLWDQSDSLGEFWSWKYLLR